VLTDCRAERRSVPRNAQVGVPNLPHARWCGPLACCKSWGANRRRHTHNTSGPEHVVTNGNRAVLSIEGPDDPLVVALVNRRSPARCQRSSCTTACRTGVQVPVFRAGSHPEAEDLTGAGLPQSLGRLGAIGGRVDRSWPGCTAWLTTPTSFTSTKTNHLAQCDVQSSWPATQPRSSWPHLDADLLTRALGHLIPDQQQSHRREIYRGHG
jgi:hypothetical protein